MANGGIIGPPNDPTSTLSSKLSTINAACCAWTRGNACSTTANILVIAGGGGASSTQGGGGGAGGYRTCTSYTIDGSTYKVAVGGGGAGTASPSLNAGTPGSVSNFNTCDAGPTCKFESTGGGGANSAGGSGGGAGESGSPGAGNTPPTSPSQGNAGGTAAGAGGGGGGAGGVGGNYNVPATFYGGIGGIGSSAWPGDSTLRGGGGGGGGQTHNAFGMRPNAGPGGGGQGGIQGSPGYPAPTPYIFATGDPGTVNTGGGGGSGGNSDEVPTGLRPGSAGGSGVVIICEPCGTKTVSASGVWSMQEQYDAAVAGDWPA